MKIRNLLCAAVAVSTFVFPTMVNAETEKSYAYTSVTDKTDTAITLYEYDKETRTLKKVYNEIDLKKTTYGTGSASKVLSVTLPNEKKQAFTVNYDNTNLGAKQVISTDTELIKNNFSEIQSSKTGAIITNTANIKKIEGDFSYNESSLDADERYMYGVAIFNDGGVIENIESDFISNFIKQTIQDRYFKLYGAAIYNRSNAITNVIGDFIFNGMQLTVKTEYDSVLLAGGAIYNAGGTLNLQSNFIENYLNGRSDDGMAQIYAGAIYNNLGTINVEGNFIGNNAKSRAENYLSETLGGAIYNEGKLFAEGDFINNSVLAVSVKNTAFAYGGAVYSSQDSQETKITGDFIGNYADSSSDSGSSFARGGAVYNNDSKLDISGDFVNNYANAVGINAEAQAYGGAVYNYDVDNSSTIVGDFIGNYAVATAVDKQIYAHGGAINNNGILVVTGDFFGNYASTVYSTSSQYANGGAIFNTGTMSVFGDFIGNSAINSRSGKYAQGGAIYNTGTINVFGNFIDNFVKNSTSQNTRVSGGAIHNTGTVNINAVNNDIEFTGNKMNGLSNAIYNTGTVNFNTDNGYKIYMNDGIKGSNGILNINGVMDLNAQLVGNTVNLNEGSILNVGANVTFDNTTKLVLNENSTLNLVDNVIKSYTINSLTGNGGNIALDINASTLVADNFYLSTSNGIGTVNLSNVNIINPQETEGKVKILNRGTLVFNDATVYTSEGKFYIENYGNGYVYIDSLDRDAYLLQNIIKFTEGDRIYSMSQNETITRNIDSMAGTQLTINGNGNTFDGNGLRGIDVANGQTLSVNNIQVKNFNAVLDGTNADSTYGGFINNKGTVANLSGTFENNTATNGSVLYNTNTVNNIDGIYSENNAQSGGVIYNAKKIENISGTYEGNKAEQDGGVIYNGANGNISFIDGTYSNNSAKRDGGVVFNTGKIATIKGSYDGNSAGDEGGVIHNNGKILDIDANFTNNAATDYAGAIYNGAKGTINSINGNFIGNTALDDGGGAIYNITGTISSINGSFKENEGAFGAAIMNNSGTIDKINGTFIDNNAISNAGGAVYNSMGYINAISGIFENNSATLVGGAIFNIMGVINIVADQNDTIFTGNKDATGSNALSTIMGVSNLNASKDNSIIFNDAIGITVDEYIATIGDIDSMTEEELNEAREEVSIFLNPNLSVLNVNIKSDEDLKLSVKKFRLCIHEMTEEEYNNLPEDEKAEIDAEIEEFVANVKRPEYTTGTVEINNKVKRSTVNMFDGILKFGTNTQDGVEYSGNLVDSNLNYYGGLVTLQNQGINSANLGNLALHNEMKLSLDADLAKETIDTISADSFTSNDNKINITNINLLSKTDKKELSLSPLSADMDEVTRQTMADSIIYSGGDVAYGDIYKYSVDYNPTNAMLNFGLKSKGGNLDDYNPTVASKPIIQAGAQSVQLDSYTEAFRNLDMFMLMPENERLAHKYRNKYASLNSELVYDPTMSTYQNNTAWFRPYTTFENVPLKNGPKVSNVSYGTYFGYDSSLHELGKGWDGTFGVYAGYNGSHQTFNGNSVYQNGGTLGLIGVLYKGNFFTGWTINAGASSGSTSNMFGEDNFNSLAGGISTKNGYNFEFANGKFIIQPSLLMSYSFINTFDYTNTVGVRMKSDPLHTLQIEPSIKLIGNIGTWQPYANVSMVWNVLNETSVTANNVELPEVSVKPYVKYGVGLQKKWGNRFTGFGQAYVMNGGRNGVGLQAGLRIAIGDETTKLKAAWLNPKKKGTVIVLDGKVK